MPGTFVFKPIEANLNRDKKTLSQIDPYCTFILGDHKVKTQICDKGSSFEWKDELVLNRDNEKFCEVKVKTKSSIVDKDIGSLQVPLGEVEKEGKMTKWFDIVKENKIAGQLLLEVDYNPFELSGKSADKKISPHMAEESSFKPSKDKLSDIPSSYVSKEKSHHMPESTFKPSADKPSHLSSYPMNIEEDGFKPSKEKLSDMPSSHVSTEKPPHMPESTFKPSADKPSHLSSHPMNVEEGSFKPSKGKPSDYSAPSSSKKPEMEEAGGKPERAQKKKLNK